MMHWKRVACLLGVYWGIVLLVAVFPSGLVQASSARRLTEEGNALYRAGKYNEALEAYEQAEREQPDSPEILFNKGNATLQKGDTAKAREAYEAAAIQAKDPALEAKCQFNLGHADFLEGEKKVPAAPREALPLYERSIRHFQNALRADPGLAEAGENIEIARIKLKDLMDRIQEQEEAAGKQQEQRQETGAEQGDQQEENDSRQERKAGNPEEPTPQREEEKKDDGSSPDTQAQDREKKECQEKPSPSGAPQQPSEGKDQPGRQQKDLASSRESQESNGEDREKAPEEGKHRQAIQEQAQDILQEEKENRQQLQRSRPAGAPPVDKDW
jgi:tetratricopeptide (TPR) repeat protein